MGKRKNRKGSTVSPDTQSGVLLIDAYNVIYADKSLTEALNTSLELARNRLRDLCRYYLQRHAGVKVILVFDGDSSVGPVPEVSRERMLSSRMGIAEIFTPTGLKADHRIISEVRDRAATVQLTVVTADIDVVQECRVAGAYVIAPAVFIQQGRPRNPKPASKHRSKQRNSSQSVSEKRLNQTQKNQLLSEFESIFGDEMDQPL